MFSRDIPPELTGRLGVYQVIHELGQGAISKVFLCERKQDHFQFALKQLCRFAQGSASSIDNTTSNQQPTNLYFDQEIAVCKILAQHRFYNLLTVCEVIYVTNDIYYLIMELCEGKDLYAFSLNNFINPEYALDFSRQIAYGLFELHSLGLSHRDIKPENVFVKIGQNGSPILKIGDFGLARKSDFMSSIVGTVSYMGPELFNEYHTHKNSSCDIWALGCIIYELIEGKQYFAAQTQVEVAIQIKSFKEHKKQLEKLGYDDKLEKEVNTVIEKCLKVNPADRISARDVVDSLTAILNSNFQHQQQGQQPLQGGEEVLQNPNEGDFMEQSQQILQGQFVQQQGLGQGQFQQEQQSQVPLSNYAHLEQSVLVGAQDHEQQQGQAARNQEIVGSVDIQHPVIDPRFVFYEFINNIVEIVATIGSRELVNEDSKTGEIPYDLESRQFYLKSNVVAMFTYHYVSYLMKSMNTIHCQVRHPKLYEISSSLKHEKPFETYAKNVIYLIKLMNFDGTDSKKYPIIQDSYERLNHAHLTLAFGLPESGDKESLQKMIQQIFTQEIHIIQK